ncbi:hypothetical protein [Streptobacillus moniliformis]|uniref:Uncharacterized protein n=1 Tax=Streptobacillus moniliformis (strain ATCC 14647 / DSM 12112 / NCTC 10651 / 9901) TaxID=519441 RepID=D1AX14_STRM9|nr:hypothetical protein [Streptobacillus moniliformis]ACZ00840.1 hypothetical protein Smon_0356 [Streptobacillus moniliformis DSM 12112]QXW65589.1 hypothetical protein KX935_07470 [Streptobacillus moniliformis]SQA14025.1 Uncharacterised protein [Streptobacillus moniliformis]
MKALIIFWKILIVFGLVWYINTIIIVGIKGFKNIKEMLEAVSDEKK